LIQDSLGNQLTKNIRKVIEPKRILLKPKQQQINIAGVKRKKPVINRVQKKKRPPAYVFAHNQR